MIGMTLDASNPFARLAGRPFHLPAVSYTHLDVYKRQVCGFDKLSQR